MSRWRLRKNPRVILLYPPIQTLPDYMCKPNGSLAYPNIAGSLIERGIEVSIYDASVGNDKDDLQECFYKPTPLPNGLYRTGVSESRILEEVRDADIVGLTSIFTAQENMVLATAKLIKDAYPEKLIFAGGVNARNRLPQFLHGGVDVVFLSEAELTILKLIDHLQRGSQDLSAISSIAYLDDGEIISQPTQPGDVVQDLDSLPLPAWHLLPNDRYWSIGRPHGGHFAPGTELRYASMTTSMGCVFKCTFCHISGETPDQISGAIGKFRIKSDDRVLQELEVLRGLGIKQVFVEDDTLFGQKGRAVRIIKKMRNSGFDIYAVNGLNIAHLLKHDKGRYVPDHNVLGALEDAGFKEVVLPFESANKRILKEYVSNKWDPDRFAIDELVSAVREHGFRVSGNYMLGFPDETREEMQVTIDMARVHKGYGLDAVNFLCVMPTPGTTLFDKAVAGGYMDPEIDPDQMNWTKANMSQTVVPPEEIEELRHNAWRQLNDGDWVKYKLSMSMDL